MRRFIAYTQLPRRVVGLGSESLAFASGELLCARASVSNIGRSDSSPHHHPPSSLAGAGLHQSVVKAPGATQSHEQQLTKSTSRAVFTNSLPCHYHSQTAILLAAAKRAQKASEKTTGGGRKKLKSVPLRGKGGQSTHKSGGKGQSHTKSPSPVAVGRRSGGSVKKKVQARKLSAPSKKKTPPTTTTVGANKTPEPTQRSTDVKGKETDKPSVPEPAAVTEQNKSLEANTRHAIRNLMRHHFTVAKNRARDRPSATAPPLSATNPQLYGRLQRQKDKEENARKLSAMTMAGASPGALQQLRDDIATQYAEELKLAAEEGEELSDSEYGEMEVEGDEDDPAKIQEAEYNRSNPLSPGSGRGISRDVDDDEVLLSRDDEEPLSEKE